MKLFLMLFLSSIICLGADYSKELAEIRSGKLKKARAEWWGYNALDCSKSLQKALNSGVKKLIISKQEGPWLTTKTLILPSNIEVVFEKGAEIKAAPDCFRGIVDCLIKAHNKKNIILRGKGIITMRKKDYQNIKLYKKAEHRHTLGIFSCENIKIQGLTFQKSGGDGIYINNVKNILIDKVVLDDHYRQGISVISAENLLVKDCIIKNTKGTAPECGIDFEPNKPNEKLINCKVTNCRFENNACSAVNVTYTKVVTKKHPLDILIENCIFAGGKYGVSFLQMQKNKDSTAKGKILYKNCRIDSPSFSALHIDTIRSTGPEITFKNLIASQKSSVAPIYFYLRKRLNENSGNLKFINCRFFAPQSKYVMDCCNYSSGALDKITGTVDFNGKQVKLSDFIRAHEFDKKSPAGAVRKFNAVNLKLAGFKAIPGKKCNLIFRGANDILLYAKKQQKLTIDLEYVKLGRYKTPVLELTLTAPDNSKITLGKLEYKSEQTQQFNFIPKQEGAYILQMSRHVNCVIVKKCSAPWAVICRKKKGLYQLLAPRGNIYFTLPANADELCFGIAGNGGKATVNATIKVDNKIVASAKKVARSKYFYIDLEPVNKARLVTLSVKANEGFYLMLPGPLLPVFSKYSENLFIEK